MDQLGFGCVRRLGTVRHQTFVGNIRRHSELKHGQVRQVFPHGEWLAM